VLSINVTRTHRKIAILNCFDSIIKLSKAVYEFCNRARYELQRIIIRSEFEFILIEIEYYILGSLCTILILYLSIFHSLEFIYSKVVTSSKYK
jgi:hypothetical protein